MPDTFDLLQTATRMVAQTRFGSPSMIVRRLRQEHNVAVTFATARNLLDQMHEKGIVGPDRGALARDVLMDVEQAEAALRPRPSLEGEDWLSSEWRANATSPDSMVVTYSR